VPVYQLCHDDHKQAVGLSFSGFLTECALSSLKTFRMLSGASDEGDEGDDCYMLGSSHSWVRSIQRGIGFDRMSCRIEIVISLLTSLLVFSLKVLGIRSRVSDSASFPHLISNPMELESAKGLMMVCES
jgi:hypothetical protein